MSNRRKLRNATLITLPASGTVATPATAHDPGAERWWILDPDGHRELTSRMILPARTQAHGWVRTWCGGKIHTVHDDGSIRPIPVVEHATLCGRCAERAREILSDERRRLHAEYEARMDAADPTWRHTRSVQEALAARGWTGQWVHVEHTVPPQLRPLYTRRQVDQAVQAVYLPGEGGGMRPGNQAAVEMEAATRERLAQARERLAVLNEHRPGGPPYRIMNSVADASGADDGW